MNGNRQQIIFWTIGIGLLVALLYLLRSMLAPFVAGFAVAYLLDPVTSKLERRGVPRAVASAALLFGFFALLVLAIVLLYPVVRSQVTNFVHRLPELSQKVRLWLLPYIQALLADAGLHAGAEGVRQAMSGSAEKAVSIAGRVLGGCLGGRRAIVSGLSLLVITPIVAFYLLRDYHRVVAHVESWLPLEQAATIRQQLHEIDRVLAGFLRGQATVCLVLAIFYGLGLSLVGLDFGLLIGLATGVLAFIPYVGMVLGLTTSAIVAVVEFWPDYPRLALVAAVFVLGSLLESGVISPKLVGDRVGLHPVWVIFALLAFATLFGFVGVLLALPVAAVIGVLARFLLQRYLESPYYLGRRP